MRLYIINSTRQVLSAQSLHILSIILAITTTDVAASTPSCDNHGTCAILRPSGMTRGTGARPPYPLPHPSLLFSLSAVEMLLLAALKSSKTLHSPDVDTTALVTPPADATSSPNAFPGRSTVVARAFFFPWLNDPTSSLTSQT